MDANATAKLVSELSRVLLKAPPRQAHDAGDAWLEQTLKACPEHELAIYLIFQSVIGLFHHNPGDLIMSQTTYTQTAGGDMNNVNQGSGDFTARDITVVKTTIDSSTRISGGLKECLKNALDTISSLSLKDGDKEDALDGVKKIAAEFDKPQPDKTRIQRLWDGVKSAVITAGELGPPLIALGGAIAQAITGA